MAKKCSSFVAILAPLEHWPSDSSEKFVLSNCKTQVKIKASMHLIYAPDVEIILHC